MLDALPRRSQRERRETTRRALVDATIACLAERGYAGTTTTEVVKRAGLSQGALFRHFPTRSALVAAAAEQLFDDLFVEFEQAFAEAHRASREPPIVLAIRELYAVFKSPKLKAVYVLYAECASDEELREALEPVVLAHGEHLRGFAAARFPFVEASPTHRTAFAALVYAMQGMTLQRNVHLEPEVERSLLEGFERVALSLLEAAEKGAPAC